MNLQAMLIFVVVFLTVSFGTPFILASFLPTALAVLGSFGVTVVAGTILFIILHYVGKEASPMAT